MTALKIKEYDHVYPLCIVAHLSMKVMIGVVYPVLNNERRQQVGNLATDCQ